MWESCLPHLLTMDEKQLKNKFSELKKLSDYERGNFTAAIFIHSVLGSDRLTKQFVIDTLKNTAYAVGPIINYSGFANGFFLEVNDTVEFLEKGGDIKELKKIVEEKVGKWESSEKKFF